MKAPQQACEHKEQCCETHLRVGQDRDTKAVIGFVRSNVDTLKAIQIGFKLSSYVYESKVEMPVHLGSAQSKGKGDVQNRYLKTSMPK